MGSLSVWHWLLFLAVALLLFGGSGKISSIMGDVAKGIKSFKKGMAEDDEATVQEGRAAPRSACASTDGDAARGRRAQQGRLEPRPCRVVCAAGDLLEGLVAAQQFLPVRDKWAKPVSRARTLGWS